MATLRFQKLAGVKLTYVPFTGSAPMMTAVLGGHVAGTFANSDDLVRFKEKIRVLGFATEERFPDFPEVPTFKEMGLDIVLATDRGVAVPPGTPEPIVTKLEAAFVEIARNPEIQAEMKKQGFVPVAMGHAESKAYIEKMTAIFKELAADLKK
jgi:tripartite-type tricarboxylate transporter receptor subunit TctC